MKQNIIIERSVRGPVTIDMIVDDLDKLAIKDGDTLLVHSSLSALGWVCGGAQSVITALKNKAGVNGTIVMPTYTGWNSDPADWRLPSVPDDWVDIIRDNMPAYDESSSVTRYMGVIPETFRSCDGVVRSRHPRSSFAAWGSKANIIIDNTSLDFPFGEKSPLANLYMSNAKIILIGAPWSKMSAWYLSSHRAQAQCSNYCLPEQDCYAAMTIGGERVWKKYTDMVRKSDDFDVIGHDFEKNGNIINGLIGHADSKVFSMVEAVDYAAEWMIKNRGQGV